jgi:hypothetical protein
MAMRLGQRFRGWGQASVVCGGLAFGWGSLAVAADTNVAAPAAASPVLDPLAPSSLLAGPSLHETGRVGVMPAADSTSPPAESLNPGAVPWAADREKSVQPVASGFTDAPPPRPPAGTLDPLLLDHEVAVNLAMVEECRIEVARARQVPPGKIAAQPLVLRWTIQPTGDTRTMDVVATGPTDQDLISCARSAMSPWRFTPPRGGAMDVERTVSFRRL